MYDLVHKVGIQRTVSNIYVNAPIRKYVYNLGRVNRLEIVAFGNIFLLLLYL